MSQQRKLNGLERKLHQAALAKSDKVSLLLATLLVFISIHSSELVDLAST